MNYLKFGESKKFIVFLHGWGANLNSFLFAKNYFCDYTKLFVDFTGFGKSPEPVTSYCVSDYVKELKNLLDDFEIEELILVGHSFGGRVAVKFVFLHQCDYNKLKLCLVDAAGIKPKLNLVKKLKIAYYKRLKEKAQKKFKLNKKLAKFGSSDYKVLSPVMKKTFVNIVNEDLSKFAARIVCDTIIIWGEKDKETKLYMAKRYNRLIKGSRLFVFKEAGHFSFLEQSQEFLIILDTFLKN